MQTTPLFINSVQKVEYTNWKGNKRVRTIKPLEIFFGATEYHPEPQWLVRAVDVEEGELRDFALKDMTPWHYNQSI